MEVRHVVTIFLERCGRILLLKRSSRVRIHRDRWAGISGYVEEGERVVDRALQELREEAGLEKGRVKLICEGRPVRFWDEEVGIFWIVHPYLFTTEVERVQLNWEHAEYRWIEPRELAAYKTVPRLEEALSRVLPETPQPTTLPLEVREGVKAIRSDREHGASWMMREAIKVLLRASEEYPGGSREEYVRYMKGVAGVLEQARPSMASLSNGVRSLMHTLMESYGRDAGVDLMKQVVAAEGERLLQSSEEAVLKVAQNALKILPGEGVVMTHSYSSTVLEALKKAHKEGRRVRVIITESRPLYEGRRLAERLVEYGIPVTLIIDAAAGCLMKGVHLVLVGADSVLSDGSVVNKVGTYSLALAAHEAGVPFYTLCERGKVDVDHYLGEEILLEEGEGSEVADPELPGVGVRNPYFDITPAKYVSGIIFEEGLLKPSEVCGMIEGMLPTLYFP